MSPSWKLGLAAVGLVAATSFAAAQVTPEDHSMHGRMGMMDGKGPMQDHHRMMKEMMHKGMKGMGQRGMMMHSGQSTMLGQDAFGAIQEIVGILEADPNTDWSKVNISALREHLVDMNEVTLKAVTRRARARRRHRDCGHRRRQNARRHQTHGSRACP